MTERNREPRYSYRDCLPLRYRKPLDHNELRTEKKAGDLELTPNGVYRHG